MSSPEQVKKPSPVDVTVRALGGAQLSVHRGMPQDHPFYALVGRVAAAWAQIEHTLDLVIWELSKVTPQYGACITAQIMGLAPRCKAVYALGKNRLSPDLLQKIKKFQNDTYKVADDRARIVHDPWFVEDSSGNTEQFRAMPHSDPRYGMVIIEEAEVVATIDRIKALQMRAYEIRGLVLGELRATESNK